MLMCVHANMCARLRMSASCVRAGARSGKGEKRREDKRRDRVGERRRGRAPEGGEGGSSMLRLGPLVTGTLLTTYAAATTGTATGHIGGTMTVERRNCPCFVPFLLLYVAHDTCDCIDVERRCDVERHGGHEDVVGNEVDVYRDTTMPVEAVVASGDHVPIVHYQQVE